MTARRKLAGAVLALWVGGFACGDAAGPDAAIEDFSGEPDEVDASFERLEESIEADPERARAAAIDHLDADDADVRYAALYTLAVGGESAESRNALLPFLESQDLGEVFPGTYKLKFGSQYEENIVVESDQDFILE